MRFIRTVAILAVALRVGLHGQPTQQRSPAAAQRQWVEIRNTGLRLTDQVTIRVRWLRGEVLPLAPDGIASLDDSHSYKIRVTSARVGLTGRDVGALLNTVVFAYPGAPLRDLRVRTDGSSLIQTGILHKVVDLRFRMHAAIALMADGTIRLHPTAMRVLGLNGETVMRIAGLHLGDLLDLRGAHGVSVRGDDLFLEPTLILPPPQIEGRLAAIHIAGDTIVEDFGQARDDSLARSIVGADSAGPGFVYFRRGRLRFGKLTMTSTDLRIVGVGEPAVLDLSLPGYQRQLVAGESRTLSNGGLRVYMPNFATLTDSTARRQTR